MVKSLDSKNFKDNISNGVTLVDFYADWCMPCKMLSPAISKLAEDFNGKINVCKINVDSAPEIAVEYSVMSIPTVILFKDGKVAEKNIGLVGKEVLEGMVKKAL
ncbi:MAG: thioredoxin [Lachnospiraceae bacterium]|nr:thioredoxin [Lachnospiraceae bacterium]